MGSGATASAESQQQKHEYKNEAARTFTTMVSALHMNGSACGDNSYANNSGAQRAVISKTRPMVEQTIRRMRLNGSFPESSFAMADMGCSSGPNTLLSLSHVIHAILRLSQSPPELQVFLNDLPTNDFNSVFLSLPRFYQSLANQKGGASLACYISGTPGSFHGRLFPASSLHFVHSSYSVHWLSQVPLGIHNNKGNIYIGCTSPQNVSQAYKEQFQKDFSNFLNHRAKELKPGGGMFLAFIGRSDDPTNRVSCLIWDLLSKSLLDMVEEGRIEEGDLDSFNIPIYYPSKREVREIVKREGSFKIEVIGSFETHWDGSDNEEKNSHAFDKQRTGQNVGNIMRAISESLVASHFGEGVIEDLFARYGKHIADHLSLEKTKFFNIVISMTKK